MVILDLTMEQKMIYFDNGNVWELYHYKDGKKDGECIEYYPSGEKRVHGYFKEGRPSGVWMTWEKDGSFDWIDMDLR